MVQINFDATQVAPNTGFEPVPEGWYNVAISESEVKPTRDGEGAMLVLKMAIIDGPHANKPIFTRLNIQNKNQQAVDIAYGELSSICHVVGVYQVADTSQLHGIPFQVKVTVRKGTDDKGNSFESNDVKAYKDAAGNEPGKAGQAGAAPGNFGGQPAQQMQQQQPAQQQNPAFGAQGGGAFPIENTPPAQQAQPAQQQQPAPNQQPAQEQWGGGQAAQPAQQPAQQGQGGWQQGQGGQPAQGGAPWGNQGQ